MENKIFFQSREDKEPIQVNEVNEHRTVKFYFDEPFSIIFKSGSVVGHWEVNSDYGWEAPEEKETPVKFSSSLTSDGKAHRIKIKLKDLPEDGFDYTVVTARGSLDPRVVPPR